MELLDGRDLRDVLQESGPIPLDLAIDYVLQVCDGLASAHAQRIVHRDLKPANLFLTETSSGAPIVKILDFGIAKALEPERLALVGQENQTLTHATQLLGSPVYMSPEQIRCSTNVDERSDVWSLGIILHELLTGATPFTASTISGLLAAIAADAPLSLRSFLPHAPVELEKVIFGCLEKDVDRRIPSVAVLAKRLRAVQALVAEGGGLAPLDAVDVSARPRGRGRVIAFFVGALVVAAALFVWFRREPPRVAPTNADVPAALPAAPPAPTAPAAPLPTAIEPAVDTAAQSETPVHRAPAPDPKIHKPVHRKPVPEAPAARAAPPADYETSATERRK
jgi:serine/threonine-protein kinase